MLDKVLSFAKQHHMFNEGDHIIVGVSGGADSVCLLLLLTAIRAEMKLTLTAVHVEHGIRGADSLDDAQFVTALCTKHSIKCRVLSCHAPEYAKERGLSLEEGARKLRYMFFEQVQKEVKAQKIAVAHNQDDCGETLLFHLVRGSGIKGMSAIAPVAGAVIRPLLGSSRDEIEAYLAAVGQPYRTDVTNLETIYTRNKIRHQVMPCLKSINAQAVLHLSQAAQTARETEEFIADLRQQAQKVHVRAGLLLESVMREPPLIQKSLIHALLSDAAAGAKDITALHVAKVHQLFQKPTGSRLSMPRGVRVARTYEGIEFYREALEREKKEKTSWILPPPPEKLEIAACDCWITTSLFEKTIEINEISKKRYTKWFDYDKIKSNLQIRTRQPGDYFVLDKKGRQKKLKEYFINEKIPARKREQILLLAEGSHIVWIVGYRISEAYKIDENTERILEVRINGGEIHE